MHNYLELADGSQRPLKSLPALVPHTYFMGSTHVEVCARLADARRFAAELKPVYTNLLFGKSRRAKQITTLVELIRAERIHVRRVHSNFIGPEFADLLGANVDIVLREPRDSNFVDLKQFLRFAAKAIAHRSFRLLRRLPPKCDTVVRGWVDTTDATYADLVNSAVLLVYPFAGSLRRQWRYVCRCRQTQRPMSLMGIPYALTDLVRIVVRWRDRERVMTDAEIRSFRAHAQELLNAGVQRLFTTDEFSAAGHEFHGLLIDNGVTTTNSAHGVAVYGPYVKYSHFRCYTARQLAHYQQRGAIASFDIAPPITTVPDAPPPADDYDPTVVFIQGNWRRAGKRYEACFEESGLQQTLRACRASTLPLRVKAHPNVSRSARARMARHLGVEFLPALRHESISHPVYVNTLSSSYFDCLNSGPTVFLHDELLKPRDLFGDHVDSVALDALAPALAAFRSADHWHTCYRRQIAREELAASEHKPGCRDLRIDTALPSNDAHAR